MKTQPFFTFLAMAAIMTAVGCGFNKQHNLPPAHQMMHPGPGVDGPGPAVMMPTSHQMAMLQGQPPAAAPTTQVIFVRPEGIQVFLPNATGSDFAENPLILPAREDLVQGGLYRMKLSGLPNRPATDLYPTIEIGVPTPRTEAYLAHNAIPIQFTEEDFDQVVTGNFVTKVIYLPDPEFQELAMAGIETLVSTRLDPGEDPIVEADRRGSIMAIIRMGNKNVVSPGLPGGGQHSGGPAVPSQYISGVNAPAYGMPSSATNIGLPGPPHIPLGGPAGMRNYTIHNHTRMDIPDPTQQIDVHVRQTPGYSYPKQPNRVFIREQNIQPSYPFAQPRNVRSQVLP